MKNYVPPRTASWSGRSSEEALYLHEKVGSLDLRKPLPATEGPVIALLGYACDDGVSRNQGRPGAAGGPEAIRHMLGRLPNHLSGEVQLLDAGSIQGGTGEMEAAHTALEDAIRKLLGQGIRPLVLGGGHDLAYPHFRAISSYSGADKRIGIINFDAHFDLRNNAGGNHSGTPFYQIAMEAGSSGKAFDYLCLGVRRDANDAHLFDTARSLGVHYIEKDDFTIRELTTVQMGLLAFVDQVDAVYVTLDLDGFSSAFAPGVSAPSPMGFSPDIVIESLRIIIDTGKLMGLDMVELNPEYDIDNHTARLASSLLHEIIHRWALIKP